MPGEVNKGGAPEGNQNAAKGNRWRRAIEKALENRCKSDGQKALVKIAEELLAKAAEGDVSALRELGDRLDGKAPQAISVGGDEENPIHAVTEVVLRGFKDADREEG